MVVMASNFRSRQSVTSCANPRMGTNARKGKDVTVKLNDFSDIYAHTHIYIYIYHMTYDVQSHNKIAET